MDMFPGVWTKINELCDSRRIISPEEVRNELEKKDDELFAWAKARPWIFRPTDDRMLTYAAEIERRFPRLVHTSSERPQADPFVIALAWKGEPQKTIEQNSAELVLVTEEIRGSGRPKIPNICDDLGIKCIKVLQMMRQEGWKFA
jgi:hypothetical protein